MTVKPVTRLGRAMIFFSSYRQLWEITSSNTFLLALKKNIDKESLHGPPEAVHELIADNHDGGGLYWALLAGWGCDRPHPFQDPC